MKEQADIAQKAGYHRHDDTLPLVVAVRGSAFGHLLDFDSALVGERLPQNLLEPSTANWNLSGRGPSICSRRPFGHLKAPLGFHCFANANFTYLDNGNVNFPDNKKYSRSKPTIIRIPPTTLMPIRLTLLFFIILFAKTNSSAPTTIIKTDINGYMSFLLSNSELLN
ncbi:MAG: hypothetical protein MR538_04010 [Faecalibacterium prausnitzii]|nr:hypothetical protein [Faecalibacterium prausnitzii]